MTSPKDFVPLCSMSDVNEGSIGSATLADGRRVAVYLVEGQVFATDDLCSHGQSSLAEDGCLDGYIVECGMHLGTFDVRTGEAVGPPCVKALRTYPVEIRDGQVMLSAAALTAELNARPPEGTQTVVGSTGFAQ